MASTTEVTPLACLSATKHQNNLSSRSCYSIIMSTCHHPSSMPQVRTMLCCHGRSGRSAVPSLNTHAAGNRACPHRRAPSLTEQQTYRRPTAWCAVRECPAARRRGKVGKRRSTWGRRAHGLGWVECGLCYLCFDKPSGCRQL